MGPGDPFGTTELPPKIHENENAGDEPLPNSEMIATMNTSKTRFLLGGLILGVLWGISVLTAGWVNTLLIMICGAGGVLLAWAAFEIASGGLDFGAAWRALRRR